MAVTLILHFSHTSYLWAYVTRSRGMSRMSLMLILSHRLKQMTYSYVLHCFEIKRIAHISWTRRWIVMGMDQKCRIWYVQVDYIENSKLNITDKWLISLDHVTYMLNIVYTLIPWWVTMDEDITGYEKFGLKDAFCSIYTWSYALNDFTVVL